MNIAITSLNGGEATPKIECRTDLDKYSSLCRHLENCLVTIYGGVIKRPGMKYLYKSTVPTGSPP
jgi:hypothetical protein